MWTPSFVLKNKNNKVGICWVIIIFLLCFKSPPIIFRTNKHASFFVFHQFFVVVCLDFWIVVVWSPNHFFRINTRRSCVLYSYFPIVRKTRNRKINIFKKSSFVAKLYLLKFDVLVHHPGDEIMGTNAMVRKNKTRIVVWERYYK